MARGGARPGAGRKPNAEKYAEPINAAEQKIVDKLPKLVGNLLKLASGGYQEVTQYFEAAGTLTTGRGEFETPVFPDKKPDEMVLVKVMRTIAAPDRAANQYLLDRIMGKPTERQELSGPDGGPIEFDDLSDDERAARVTELLERARARRDGQAPPAQPA